MNKTKIFFLLGFLIFSSVLVSASFLETLGKDNVCEMLNVTDNECDALWCEEVIECSYNSTRQACICTETVEINITNNVSNTADFYNKTQVDNLLKEINESFEGINLTNNSIGNQTVKEYIDEKIKNLLTSTDEKIDDLLGDTYEPTNNRGIDPIIIVIIVAVVLVVVVSFFMKKKQGPYEKTSFEKGEARPVHKKIQNLDEMKKDDEIEMLKREIAEAKKEMDAKDKEEKPEPKPKDEIEELKQKIKEMEEQLK